MFLLSILVTIPQNLHKDKGKGKKKSPITNEFNPTPKNSKSVF